MTDRHVVLAVVYLMGLFAVSGLSGSVWLISVKADPANIAVIAGLTGTALGSLGTLLASTKSHSETPQIVEVQQPANNPVPVEQSA